MQQRDAAVESRSSVRQERRLLATKELGVDETSLKSHVLLLEIHPRVRRTSIMQCDEVGPQLDIDQTALVTGSREIIE